MTDRFCPFDHKKSNSKIQSENWLKFLFYFIKERKSWMNLLPSLVYKSKIEQISLYNQKISIINDLEIVGDILVNNSYKYPKHSLLHYMLEDLLGISAFTTNGSIWQRLREIVDKSLQNSKVDKVFPAMQAAANDMLERLQNKSEKIISIDEEMTFVTADVIFRTIFSQKLHKDIAHELFNNFAKFQKYALRMLILKMCKLVPIISRVSVRKYAKRIRKELIIEIDARYSLLEQGVTSPDDILNTLMNYCDSNNAKFTREELIDQVCMLFLAGHETSSTTLAWSLWLLANDTDVQDSAYNEIVSICGNEEITLEYTKKLHGIRNIFKESMRLFPPITMLLKEATEDHQLLDRFVRKGELLIISPWIIHRHADVWNEAEFFEPSRFNNPECKYAINKGFIPFGKGARICPGAGFATQEAILVLATIIRNFRIETDSNHIPKPVDRATLRSENGIKIKLIRR